MAGNSAAETLIGAIVLVAAGGFAYYGSQAAGTFSGGGDRYELLARFNSAEGVSVGTDVRLAGVKVGTVTALALNPDTYQAELRFAVDEQYLIPDDSELSVASEGLLGGSYLEIEPGGSEFMLGTGDEVAFTQSSVSLLNLLLQFATGDGS
ncbi:MAG: outer membrane lipid asymmetry maintenance protein MlaD [Pseudomonadota bacterium]